MKKTLLNNLYQRLHMSLLLKLLTSFNAAALIIYILCRSILFEFAVIWKDELYNISAISIWVSAFALATYLFGMAGEAVEYLVSTKNKHSISFEEKTGVAAMIILGVVMTVSVF